MDLCLWKSVSTECNLSEIFGIRRSPNYIQYDDSIVSSHTRNKISHIGYLPGYTRDYEDDYNSELEDIFAYSIYHEGDKCILKLKIEKLNGMMIEWEKIY